MSTRRSKTSEIEIAGGARRERREERRGISRCRGRRCRAAWGGGLAAMDTTGKDLPPEEGAESPGGSVESGMLDAHPEGAAAPALPSGAAEAAPATAQAAADPSAAPQPEAASGHDIQGSETPVCEIAARAPARHDASAGHAAAPADARAATTSAASPCDLAAALPHSSAGDGAGAGEDGRTDAMLGKRTRRPTSKAIAGEASSVAPAAASSAPPAAVAVAAESMVVTVDPAADSVMLLRSSFFLVHLLMTRGLGEATLLCLATLSCHYWQRCHVRPPRAGVK